MFQSARPNSRAYVLFKGKPFRLEQGYIVNQPMVHPKYQLSPTYTTQQEMVVDLTIKTDSGSYNFNGIPSSLDIADTFCNGEAAVISDSRDAMNAEVLSLKQKSQEVISSVNYHNDIIKSCDDIMGQLNPEYAEKRERDEEISSLRGKVNDLSGKLDLLIEKLSINKE